MSRKGSCICPACGKDMAPKAIHAHTEVCEQWKAKFGAPFPYFKFSAKPKYYVSSAIEGIDYVRCYACASYGWDFRFLRMAQHLKLHNLTEASYAERYPGKPIRLELTNERRKTTVRSIYGVDNVFQAESVKKASKETLLEKYGVDSPLRSKNIRDKASKTNLERYGAENPFVSEVIKEKIKQVCRERYEVDHPNQNPEMLSHSQATNLERYGAKCYFETEAFINERKKNKKSIVEDPSVPSIICPYCYKRFYNSKSINSRHKAVCPGWGAQLGDTRPKPCLCGHESTSHTQMKRHLTSCEVWKSRDRTAVRMACLAETLQAKYGEGVTLPFLVPGAKERCIATNLERYGAENVFSKESAVFEKVQASLEGKRPIFYGQDNAFSKLEVQEKIRQSNLAKYGVVYPNQSPVIRAKTRATNLQRYGSEEGLAAPIIRQKIAITNQERYGGPSPACSPEVVEKARLTNLERWGVEWTGQSFVLREQQLETMLEHYGAHFFASEEGKRIIRTSLLDKYGVPFAAQIEGHWERCVATFRAKYGVDHPRQDPVYFQSILNRIHLPGPNQLELYFANLNPELLYTGNGAYWCWFPTVRHYKNPDFILPGSDLGHPKKGVTKLVEVFGQYWHSRKFTGKEPLDHERELISAYKDIGISCLVVWEAEIKSNPEIVREKVKEFLLLV